jgi:hypothetical protein
LLELREDLPELEDLPEPDPELRLAEDLLLPPRALARSLCARLVWLLARPPLLDDGEDFDEEEEEELRDAIACSFAALNNRPSWVRPRANPGSPIAPPVGARQWLYVGIALPWRAAVVSTALKVAVGEQLRPL